MKKPFFPSSACLIIAACGLMLPASRAAGESATQPSKDSSLLYVGRIKSDDDLQKQWQTTIAVQYKGNKPASRLARIDLAVAAYEGLDDAAYRLKVLAYSHTDHQFGRDAEPMPYGQIRERVLTLAALRKDLDQLLKDGEAALARKVMLGIVRLSAAENTDLTLVDARLLVERPDFAEVSGLPADEVQRLESNAKDLDEFYKTFGRLNSAYYDALMQEQKWMDQPATSRPANEREIFFGNMKKAFKETGDNQSQRFALLQELWRVRLLATKDGDAVLLGEVKGLLGELLKETSDPLMRRWTQEALTQDGERPTKVGHGWRTKLPDDAHLMGQ